MTNRTQIFLNGLAQGIRAPISFLATMYGVSRAPVENPFKDLKLGSVQTDKQNIRHDFGRAIQDLSNGMQQPENVKH